jgi:hypothetical protein
MFIFYLIQRLLFVLLANSGQTVHKYRNLGLPAPPVSMATAQCGVTAKTVVQFLW